MIQNNEINKNKTIYVIGHKNPDTDAVCSAIAYAELKKRNGLQAVPVVQGDINRETRFVLEYFGINIPHYLYTVKTQVSDLNIDTVNAVHPDVSIKTAWNNMVKNNIKILPVVDNEEKLNGLITSTDIAHKNMDALDNYSLGNSGVSLENILATLNAKLVCGTGNELKIQGKILISSANHETLEKQIKKGDLVITGGIRENIMTAIEHGANCIVITCGNVPEKDVVNFAVEKKCIIMITETDTFSAGKLINQSIPVGHVMTTKDIVKFHVDDFIDDIKGVMMSNRHISYPVVDDDNVVKGFIDRYHLMSPNRKKVILVDHNEKSQTVDGIDQADILEIIDHHRLGDIQTMKPVYFKNEPVGSTSTIIAGMFFESGVIPSKDIAGILCAAIISDTLIFKSPTSTYADEITAQKLAQIAGINIEEFAMEMFRAATALGQETPEELFKNDLKEYVQGKHKLGVAQIYTIDFEKLDKIVPQIIEYMKKFSREHKFNLMVLMITDILTQTTELIFCGDSRDAVARAFHVKIDDENSIFLKNVVSRKKQVVPKLLAAMEM